MSFVMQTPEKLGALYNGPIIIGINEVTAITCLSRSSIYALMKKGEFPQKVVLISGRVGWLLHEVEAWLQVRINARQAKRGG